MVESSLWNIVETEFSVDQARAYEGLFTLGSGQLHVRGSLEEHLYGATQNHTYMRTPTNVTAESFPESKLKWGTYVPGLYGRHPLLNLEMINLPWCLGLIPVCAHEKLDLEESNLKGYERTLNLHEAVLSRSLTWHPKVGGTIDVRFDRFVSAKRPDTIVQRLTMVADRDMSLDIHTCIDADVRTSGYDHFKTVSFGKLNNDPEDDSYLSCDVLTDNDDQVRIVSQLLGVSGLEKRQDTKRLAEIQGTVELKAGEIVTVEKRTIVATSLHMDVTEADGKLEALAAISYDKLLGEHKTCWEAKWQQADVEIAGPARDQLAMRTSIYHLLRCYVPDNRVAIDAKGYAGDAYFGRFFWDTEMYMFPFFLYTAPECSKTLMEFRLQGLEGARANAREYGYEGARYAWESASDGREQCSAWQYRDHEVHVTADIVYAFSHYAKAVEDDSFLTNEAAETIVETARYWKGRVDWRKGEERPCLLGVMGPDEYTPLSSNNAYTNRVVSYALSLAADPAVGAKGGATEQERAIFKKIADGLPILREGNRVLQCEEFDKYAEPDFERLWTDRTKCFAAQVPQEYLYRTRCPKQADVLMLMMLFPNEFSREEVEAAWDYYLPFTTHDSSLSAGAHAIMACRLDKLQDAFDFWLKSSQLDMDFAHGGAEQGVHIANAGANWQIAVFGFAGMRTAMESDTFTLEPKLPAEWSRLSFPVRWKGKQLKINIDKSSVAITNLGEASVRIKVYETVATVLPGETETISWG